MGGHGPHMMPAPSIFQKHSFFRNDPKNLTKVENFKKKFCILGNHFIRLLYSILSTSFDTFCKSYNCSIGENWLQYLLLSQLQNPAYESMRVNTKLQILSFKDEFPWFSGNLYFSISEIQQVPG